jgi:hypothetical protein
MDSSCQIEYVASWSDQGLPCGKPAVGTCSDCGTAICADCQEICCRQSFCIQCYDYHLTTACRKPVQNERNPYPALDAFDKTG